MTDRLPTTDIAAMLEAAAKAQGGPWVAWSEEGTTKSGRYRHSVCRHTGDRLFKDHVCVAETLGDDEDDAYANADHIANCSPDRLIPLLRELLAHREAIEAGWKLVPPEPTLEMLVATLPMPGVHVDLATMRLAENALRHLESSRFPLAAHRQGLDAACALIGDYRAMLEAAPLPLSPESK